LRKKWNKKTNRKQNFKTMKRKSLKILSLSVLMLAASCDEPETVVMNIVHTDGSVTRRIEMRNTKNNFGREVVQVPVDSTWTMKDSISIGEKNDTTWFKTAEKSFKNVDEINKEYQNDKGLNKKVTRSASFTKKFRWFNTVYTFSEKLENSLQYGYPPEKFFAKDELEFFYLPESISREKLSGADSTKYKELYDRVKKKTDRYFWSSVTSEWIGEFSNLTSGRSGEKPEKDKLKSLEAQMVDTIMIFETKSDSAFTHFLASHGYGKFRTEADSATTIIDKRLDSYMSFGGYTDIFVMPGRVTASNGYVLKKGEIMWPVSPEFFLSQPYVMQAESKMPNIWAWIVSGVFLLFVLGGVALRLIKKG
jgi:hypothetical protein